MQECFLLFCEWDLLLHMYFHIHIFKINFNERLINYNLCFLAISSQDIYVFVFVLQAANCH